jgi:TPR repeat protein
MPAAQRLIGVAYAEGAVCRAIHAAPWPGCCARRTDDADAQFNLGVMLANGKGVEQDLELALVWYQRAAEAGHVLAQYNLGSMYARGRGVDRDERRALEWYRMAAEQGAASAQFNGGDVRQRPWREQG